MADVTFSPYKNGVLFLLLFSVSLSVWGQNEFTDIRFHAEDGQKQAKYSLTGRVTDRETQSTLSGVAVHVDGLYSRVVTDEHGLFLIHLDSGRHRIVFRQFGKRATYYIVHLFGDGVLNTELRDLSFELEAFTVLAEQRDRNVMSPITGITKMNIEEIKLVPALMGEPDVFNVLQAMPGVTSVGEGSAGMNIRGGQADQNLIMMNEAIVLNNNHALGFLSSFNGDVVQNFTLYKGTVPGQFGGRSASALNIEMKKGDFENWSYSGSVGTAVSKVLVEGPIRPEKTSMVAALRRSNSNWLLNTVEEPDIRNSNIRFHDIFLGLNHKIGTRHTIDFNLLNTGDRFSLSDRFGFEWGNLVTSLTSKNLITQNLSLIGMVAYGSFDNRFFEPGETDPFMIANGLSYYQGKISALRTWEAVELLFGAEGVHYQMKPETLNPFEGGSDIIPQSVQKQRGLEWAPFASLEWNPDERWALGASVRYSQYRQLGPDSLYRYQEGLPYSRFSITEIQALEKGNIVSYGGFEPRLSLRWTFLEGNSIKAGYSNMFQYLQTISNTTGPTPIDLWQLSTTYIPPQRSHNYSLGYFRNWNEDKWSTSVEGFYRATENQVEYRDFADLFLNPHLETELVQGEGKAYGLEVLVQKNRGIFTGWLSYTFSRSLIRTLSDFQDIQVNRGNWYPTNFDRPHILSLVSTLHLGNKRSFNTHLNYSTGRPVTGIASSYTVGGIPVPNYGDRNQYRIPNYMRVEISYLTNGFVRTWEDSLNFSIYNLLGRRNAYSVFFQKDPNSSRLVPYQISILGAVFPSISYTVAFNK
jgi:hypothetical protein